MKIWIWVQKIENLQMCGERLKNFSKFLECFLSNFCEFLSQVTNAWNESSNDLSSFGQTWRDFSLPSNPNEEFIENSFELRNAAVFKSLGKLRLPESEREVSKASQGISESQRHLRTLSCPSRLYTDLPLQCSNNLIKAAHIHYTSLQQTSLRAETRIGIKKVPLLCIHETF